MDDMNTVVQGDCIAWMESRPEPFADLVFADPPFNIGYQYDVYEDVRAYDEYHEWTARWMGAVARHVLKPTGSFWVAIGDEYAAEVRLIGRDLGLTLRNWVIWHYTFGQNTKAKFCRSHAHLFYFTADPKEFTFDDAATRTFSDRQRVYRDKRANPRGKLPDDTWGEFPRLCGTFGEREGWHPCQMPVSVLSRIIRTTSRVGDVVFDPFSGSGTTLVAAKRLGRQFLGTELSPAYAANIERRLDETLALADEPAGADGVWPAGHVEELKGVYQDAAVDTTLLLENSHLLDAFVQFFNDRLAASGDARSYTAEEVWQQLEALRRQAAALPRIRVHAAEPAGPVRDLAGGAVEKGRRERRRQQEQAAE